MKSPDLRQRKVQALPSEPLRPVLTFYTTQNTITSLIAAPLDIRTPSDNVFLREVPVDVFFAAITNFLAVRPICTLLSLLLLSGIADLSLLTIPSTSSVWRCLLSLRFLQLPTMPFGQMSDPLLCAVCSSLLFLSVRLQSAALWSS